MEDQTKHKQVLDKADERISKEWSNLGKFESINATPMRMYHDPKGKRKVESLLDNLEK